MGTVNTEPQLTLLNSQISIMHTVFHGSEIFSYGISLEMFESPKYQQATNTVTAPLASRAAKTTLVFANLVL